MKSNVDVALGQLKRSIEGIKAWERTTNNVGLDMTVGEAVDDAVSKLREVGIVIEGGHAHLAHAILRSAMKTAVRQVEASNGCNLENNEEAQQ